ncbi:MAG TPA: hypothetical protein VFI02_06720, partial [Armatimonadota bacterium]|nr:hypothetical protein [Armatimonadota bacterium]
GPASEVTKAPESLAPALSPEQKLADRQTTAEEDIATIFDEEGQGSLFDVASPTQIRQNLGVRLKHLRAAFANTKWKFERGADGTVLLKIPNGPTLSFSFSADLVAERAAAHGGDYAKLAKSIAKGYEFSEDRIAEIADKLQANHGLIKGSYTFDTINASHLIVLNRLSAGPDTLFHEAFHFVFKNYLRPSQRKALIEHYGNEEKAAKAYGVLAAKQFENLEKMNAAERILYEVYDFARQMLKYVSGDVQSAADLMEAIYTGQIYEQPWLGTARLHSTESAGGRLRMFSGGPEPVLKLISREIKNSVEFEDGTTIKAELSQSSYSAALKNAMSEFIPTVLGGRFYSRLAQVVVDAPQKKWGSAEEFLSWVKKQPGVKDEEIYWTGLKQAAEVMEMTAGEILRADVQVYLQNNGVKIEETLRGKGAKNEPKEALDRARKAIDEWYAEAVEQAARHWTELPRHEVKNGLEYAIGGDKNYEKMFADQLPEVDIEGGKRLLAEYREADKANWRDTEDRQPKWATHTEPGGKDYRELTIRAMTGKGYVSHAFPERDIIVWVRFDERTDENGRRVLFIEEIQSDLHQEGKKKGYYDARAPKWEVFDPTMASKIIATFDTEAEAKEYAENSEERGLDYAPAGKGYAKGELVPATPFAGNLWPELALKRMMIWAAENGFDRVSWTTAEQQARRANQLIEGIARVQYNPETKVLTAFEKDGEGALRRGRLAGTWEVEPEDLPRYVGKEAAEKLLAAPLKEERWGPSHEIEGEGLRINASSFESLYDKTLRNIASKLGKKHGAGVDVQKVDFGSEFDGDEWRADQIGENFYNVFPPDGVATSFYAQSRSEAIRRAQEEAGIDVTAGDLSPQQGIDIGGDLREELLGGATMFELDDSLFDDPVVRITDPDTLFAPETQAPPDGLNSTGLVLSRTMVKEWIREHVIRNLFDKLEPIRHLQEVLTEYGHTLNESMDAYLKARNFSAKAGAALNKLQTEYFQPLVDKLAALEMPLK